ncbi:MAG: carboxypeptidase regulatory-like domain-containing protein [bacterium]|nr:carboxypeptidase regulatory-like domain-containing protein [bacterium]
MRTDPDLIFRRYLEGTGALRSPPSRIVAPPAGTEAVVMIPLADWASLGFGTLVLHVTATDGSPVDCVEFRLLALDGQEPPPVVDRRTLRADGGRFVLDEVRAGDYLVRVRPTISTHARRSIHVPTEITVAVRAGASTEHRVALSVGGRLRLGVRDEAGDHVPATVTLRDARGRECAVHFELVHPDGSVHGGRSRLDRAGVYDVVPALAPGRYELELSCVGLDPSVMPVRVEAGETTEAAAVLRHRSR